MEATNKDIDATFDVEDLTLQFSQLEMILISIHPYVRPHPQPRNSASWLSIFAYFYFKSFGQMCFH